MYCFLERVKSKDFGEKPTQIPPLAGWPWRDMHLSIDTGHSWEFPGGPVAKTPCCQCRGLGSIPGQGTRSHMLQLRVPVPKLKILNAATKSGTAK